MEDNSKLYQEGFNHGYILQKFAPELADLITKNSNPDSEYFAGLQSGKQEHQMEKIQQSLKSKSQNNFIIRDIGKDIEKEK